MVDFSDAHQKLVRAREHISQAETIITSFLSTDFYKLRHEENQGKGRMKIDLDSFHQIDKRLNAVVGDVISNLRSVLDYVAVAIMTPVTGDLESIGFPFADDVKSFTGQVTKGCLRGADKTVIDYFINEVQTYKGGKGHSLWVLNKLRNIDKHRFLLCTLNIAQVRMSWRDVNNNVFTNCRLGVTAGQRGTVIDAPINHIEITDNPRPAFQVTIQEQPYVNDAPLIAFLEKIAGDVETFLNALKVAI
jgi:hypothetical protein